MLANKTLLTASNLNNAYISKTDTNPQSMNSTLTLSGGALTLKNSVITDNANSGYLRIDPQGNNVIIYDGVNNQRLDIFSSSGSESTYLTTLNGTTSIGVLDVSSAIDHLEINNVSKKKVYFGGEGIFQSTGIGEGISLRPSGVNLQGGGRVFFIENKNEAYGFSLGYNGDSADSILNWDTNSFNLSQHNNTTTGNIILNIPRDTAQVNIYGALTTSGKATLSGGVGITGTNSLSFDTYGGGFNMTDTTWIRTTGNKSFYQNSGTMRTDGTLQVGNGGATLNVPSNGTFNYMSGKFTIATDGTTNISGTTTISNVLSLTKTGIQGSGLKIGSVNIDSVNGRDIAFQNLDAIRFGDSTGWGYNNWAGIKYDSTNLKLYIGGPASTQFSSNSSPATIDMAFTGVGHVGINNDSPTRTLDVGGDIRLSNNLYSPSVVNMYSDTSTSQGMRVGSLVIGSDYTKNAPTNGLYVQGRIGINNTNPAYSLDVSGDINVTGVVYSPATNAKAYQVGGNSELWDISVVNTLGLYGHSNTSVGGLKLGSTGPTLYGTGNMLGIGTTSPAYTLDVNGNIAIGSGNAIYDKYNNQPILKDYGNGNLVINGAGAYLYLGYQNTTKNILSTPLYGSNLSTEIIAVDGTIYYKGSDINGLYLRQDGTSSMSGDLNLSGHRVVFNNGGLTNLDHIWFDDNSSSYGDGGSYHFVADASGNAIGNATLLAGSLAVSNQIDMQNHNINSISILNGQYGTIAKSTDEWLRINDDGTHTNGVYFGGSIVRTDGTLQVGNGGATLSIPQNGTLNWQNGNLTISSGGALTAKGQIVSNTAYGQGQGFKLDTVTIDTAISTGNVAIGGLNQLRFGTSTVWDYNQWAGIKYDSTSHYLYIGGPASSQFNSNSSPPTINVSFTGVGNVGVGTDTPTRKLDINGDTRISGNIYGGTGTLNLLTDAGGALPLKAGSLAITSSYSNSAPTNGLYVQGNVGIGTTSPSGKFQVTESAHQMYTGSDHLYLKMTSNNQYPYFGLLDSGGTRGMYFGAGTAGSYITLGLENGNNLNINGGNVGIGTSTPAYPLDVVGNIQSSGLYISNSNGDVFQALGTGTGTKTFRWDHSNLRFWTNSVEVMTLTSGGNVGIGQASPSYKLDVGGDINVTGVVYSPASNAKAYQVGGNSELWDINVTDTLGLYGHSNTAVGGLKLGSTGPTLYGSGGTLGIGTTAPWTPMALDVNGSIRIASNHGIYSGYSNTYIINDHGNGNVTLSATNSASGNLYLGYVNTSNVYLATKLTTTSRANIIGTDGTLYYKGINTDSVYLRLDGTNSPTSTIGFGGKTIDNINNIQIQDPGVNEGIQWMNGYGWGIFESPDTLTNSSGNMQFAMNGTTRVMTLGNDSNAWFAGNVTVGGYIDLQNDPLKNVTYIYGQYGTIASSRDEWLRLNDDSSHTSGTYFGSTVVRTDGQLQVGSSGSKFLADATGNVTLAGTLSLSASSPIIKASGDNAIQFKSGSSGTGMVIGAGGLTILGAGESATTFWNGVTASGSSLPLTSDTESLYLVADKDICFYPNMNSGFGVSGNTQQYFSMQTGGDTKLNVYNTQTSGNTNSSIEIRAEGGGFAYLDFATSTNDYDGRIMQEGTTMDLTAGDVTVNSHRVYRHSDNIKWGSGSPSGGQDGDIWIQI